MAGVTYGPKFYEKVARAYEQMKAESIRKNGQRVWSGHVTKLVRTCDIPPAYQSPVVRVLEAMGCVSRLQQGGGPKLTQYLLVGEPTIESYEESLSLVAPGSHPGSTLTKLKAKRRALYRELEVVREAIAVAEG